MNSRVEAPVFIEKNGREQAIRYARGRTSHRFGEIRLFNAAGEIEETTPFDNRRLIG